MCIWSFLLVVYCNCFFSQGLLIFVINLKAKIFIINLTE